MSEDVRTSDAERDQAVARLRDATVEGRLTLEEFSERVGRAQLTATRAELERLVGDLPAPATASPAADVRHRVVFSELVRRGPWRLPPRSTLRCIFGTVHLDLREATLGGPVVELDVYNAFGTVTVLVPAGVAVDVEGGGLLASQEIQTAAGPTVVHAPRLLIRAAGPGGTLRVRTTPRSDRVETFLDRIGLGKGSGG